MSTAERVGVLVVGAGPAGLGAAWRLAAAGRSDWMVVERESGPGGLSRSFRDPAGFTWDLGGHIVFSRIEAFNRMLDQVLRGGFREHERRAFVRIARQFVPYPFQNNVASLPEPLRSECLAGLAAAAGGAAPANFAEWFERSFGAGVARHFMRPYNRKVWRCEPEELSTDWLGDRVAPASGKGDNAWGPNQNFRFPKTGGTGAIWRALAARLPAEQLRFGAVLESVDLDRHECRLADGTIIGWNRLVTTLPVTELAQMTGRAGLAESASALRHTAVEVFGLGLSGRPPEALADKCWLYFPDPAVPFYRLTVFSNYSPANVPEPVNSWSLMMEVSRRPDEPADPAALWPRVEDALRSEGWISGGSQVISRWHRSAPYAYPVPTLGRDAALSRVLPALEEKGVISCGRFGAWRYEAGNMDHCFAQGQAAAERLLAEGVA